MYIISKLSLVYIYTEAQTPTEPSSLRADVSVDLQPSQSSGTTWTQSDFHSMPRLPTSEQAVLTYRDTNVTTTGRKKYN